MDQKKLTGTVALVTGAAANIPVKLLPEDIAESIAYMVTWHPRSSIAELWAMPTSQA
jgi:NADP-dependent 3-hydroxy acid dehydrogenase YdfG